MNLVLLGQPGRLVDQDQQVLEGSQVPVDFKVREVLQDP